MKRVGIIIIIFTLISFADCENQNISVGRYNVILDFDGLKIQVIPIEREATEVGLIDNTTIIAPTDNGACYIYSIEYFRKPFQNEIGDMLITMMKDTCVNIVQEENGERYFIATGYAKLGGQKSWGKTKAFDLMRSVGCYQREIIIICEFRNETMNRNLIANF